MARLDTIEYEKRIRIVMEWILEDWPSYDIVSQIIDNRWCDERQAKRYLAEARRRWMEDNEELLEQKRRTKIEVLRKRQRSLKQQYQGTPKGMNAINAIEKLIIKLEGLEPEKKLKVFGDKENPIPVQQNVSGRITHNLIVKKCG